MTEHTRSKLTRRYARQARAAEGAQSNSKVATPAERPKPPKAQTKVGKVITLLERDEGATLDNMVETTGWLPHTTRAALTGLKKKGYTIERGQRDGTSVYRITVYPA